MKRIVLALLFFFHVTNCSAASLQSLYKNKIFTGVILTLAGILIANDGFTQKIVTEEYSEDIMIVKSLPYSWSEVVVDQEWDTYTGYNRYKNGSSVPDSSMTYADLSPTSIAYSYSFSDVYWIDYDYYIWTSYYNHHRTYKTVTKTSTISFYDTETVTIQTQHKEFNNFNEGIVGIALLSVGLTNIIDYVASSKIANWSKVKPEIKVYAYNNNFKLATGIRF